MGIVEKDGVKYRANVVTFVGELESNDRESLEKLVEDNYEQDRLHISRHIDFSDPDEKIWSLVPAEDSKNKVYVVSNEEYHDLRP